MLAFPNIDPVIISFGPLAISWYSLSYVVGILLAWAYCIRIIRFYNSLGIKTISIQDIDDFISWAIIGIIIGGRLGYVIFYDPEKYLANPIDILKTYQGGMSFHGGIIGFAIAAFLFCRYNTIKFWSLIDLCAASAPIGLFLGRIANFINAELYGRTTDVPWAVIFPYSDLMPRHPSQLYESVLEGVVTFFILGYLIFYRNGLQKSGKISGYFLILYAVFRSFVEFFREPDYKIGYIFEYFTMGQILCLPMFFIGLYLVIKSQEHANRSINS